MARIMKPDVMTPRQVRGHATAEGRSTIRRVLTILSAFSGQHERLSLADLDRITGLPKPSLHRLCGQLVEEGALERGADGRYQVGARMWLIGSGVPMIRMLREIAPQFMATVSAYVPGDVLLMTRQGLEVLVISRLSGRDPGLTGVQGGRPLTESAAGLVMLAHAGAEVRETAMRGSQVRGRITSCELRTALDVVRQRGYARTPVPGFSDRSELSVPIRDGAQVSAAMSVIVRTEWPIGPPVAALRLAGEGIGSRMRCDGDEKRLLSRGASQHH